MKLQGGYRYTAVLWALCVSCALGCQSNRTRPYQPPTVQNLEETQPKLTAEQTAEVQVALGRSFEKRGDVARAIAAYKEALQHDNRRADAYLRLAILHDKLEKFDKSAEFYRLALKRQPGNADIYCDMGYSLYLQRRWPEAEMNLRQALTLKPDHTRAHNNLGLVLAHQERTEEALAEFRQGGCTPADAQVNVAFALTLKGHWDQARRHYELALAADPSSRAAQEGIQELDKLAAKPSPKSSQGDRGVRLTGLEKPSWTAPQPVARDRSRSR